MAPTSNRKQQTNDEPTLRQTRKSRLLRSHALSQPLRIISAREFAARFADGVRTAQQSFTWFFGAGCSISSGISDAAGLVQRWLTEQHAFESDSSDFDTWIRHLFPSYDAEQPAKLYAKAFSRRHPSPIERQREIEQICSRGEPAYGYATLAQLLSHRDFGRSCNTILTTNFDDLIADALYLYGERNARPLVVTHEALARYVKTNSPKPTIVKLHGDAHLDPKNLEPETNEIDIDLCRQLYPFLQDQALIFVGYGGNDESILKFVQNCPLSALAPPIFWVSKQEPPAPFAEWLYRRSALRVDHTDFDQLMHLIRDSLEIELLDQKRWNHIGDRYYRSYERLKKTIDRLSAGSEDTDALKMAVSSAEKSLPDEWAYYLRAKTASSDAKEIDKIYREGLAAFPDSKTLNVAYGIFLYSRNIDINRGEASQASPGVARHTAITTSAPTIRRPASSVACRRRRHRPIRHMTPVRQVAR